MYAVTARKRSQARKRNSNDIDHQSGTPAETVGHHAEEKCSHRAHGQRNKDGFRNGRNFGMEVSADGTYAEDQDEEVERVKRPAKKAGNKGVSLDRGKTLQSANEAHAAIPRESWPASMCLPGSVNQTSPAQFQVGCLNEQRRCKWPFLA